MTVDATFQETKRVHDTKFREKDVAEHAMILCIRKRGSVDVLIKALPG